MIRLVTLKGFKRFADTPFPIPGHVVLAGPNNTGKTTLLQAIAAWEFGFRKWRELNSKKRFRNGYQWQDLERLEFSAVAVRSFEMLWTNRQKNQLFEIGIQVDGLPLVALEFRFKAHGLMQVRPKAEIALEVLRDQRLAFHTTFIPAMSGLARHEPRLADQEAIDSALAQGRPGEVLRNLLDRAHQDETAWRTLNATIHRLFSCRLETPKRGEELVCEYRQGDGGTLFDIASAGSGFLQILLLFTLLLTQHRTADSGTTVLLIDEPDAHLHLLLQRSIYTELRSVATSRQAQLFVATHSEMIVNNVEARELYLMYGTPRLVANITERSALVASLGVLTHSDILEADGARGVIYTEDFTDIAILTAFAQVLNDEAAHRLFSNELLTKSSQAPLPDGLGEFKPHDHWKMLKLIRPDVPALELLDGDNKKNKAPDLITGNSDKLQRIRWRRYEIESYLIHPVALQRFVEKRHGVAQGMGAPDAAGLAIEALKEQLAFLAGKDENDPLVRTYFREEPISKTLLPEIMTAVGLDVPKREFYEIATQFLPEEVHPEIVERLGQIKQAFGV